MGFRGKRKTYWVQAPSEINSNYIEDPIQTLGMAASMLGQPAGEYITNAISAQGSTKNKYYNAYQYATKRYKTRNFEWTFKREGVDASSLQASKAITAVNKQDLANLLGLKEPFLIAWDETSYEDSGPYFYWHMQKTYGVDSFDKQLDDGSPFNVDSPISARNVVQSHDINYEYSGLVVGDDDADDPTPYIITDGVWDTSKLYASNPYKILGTDLSWLKKSIGVCVWTTDQSPVITSITQETTVLEGLNKALGESWTVWEYDGEGNTLSVSTSDSEFDFDDTATDTETGKRITYTVTAINGNSYTLDVVTEEFELTFNEENFYWITEDGNTNLTGLESLMTITKKTSSIDRSNTSSETNPRLFELFPTVPIIKDWFTYVNYGSQKYLKAVANSTNSNDFGTEPDTTKSARADQKAQRSVDTILKRSQYYLNKTKAKPEVKKEVAHFEQICDLASLDYISLCNGAKSDSESYGKMYDNFIMQAIRLRTMTNANMVYLYTFFNRLRKMIPNGGYDRFKESLETYGKSNVPVYTFDFANIDFYGGFSFAYIKKFNVKLRDGERTRQIKRRQTRVYDIRRGDLIDWNSSTIEEILNLPETFLKGDDYYTTDAGKDHNIGGGITFGLGNSVDGHQSIGSRGYAMFSKFGYTFFCKPSSNGEVQVIAVAGLAMYTKQPEGRKDWCPAWRELETQYYYNRQRFIKKKSKSSIEAYIQMEWGSRRRKKYNRIDSFFLIPVDMRTVSRMGASNATRLAMTAPLLCPYIYESIYIKWYKTKGFATFMKIVAIIVAIVVAVYTWYTGPEASAGAYAAIMALVEQVAVNLVVAAAVSYLAQQLVKVLGIKGFLALVVAIVIYVLASAYGADTGNYNLPFASEVANLSTLSVLQTGVQFANAGINADLKNKQKQLENKQKELEYSQSKLAELELEAEDRESSTTVWTDTTGLIYEALQTKFKNPESLDDMLELGLNAYPNELASFSYIEDFLNQKLNVDPYTFDLTQNSSFGFNLRS